MDSTPSVRVKQVSIALVGALYLFVINFPELPFQLTIGLDSSWMYGINQAQAQHLHFGSEINYSYGPLGFAVFPLNVGSNLAYAFGLNVGVTLLTAGLGALALYRSASVVRGLLFVGGLTAGLRIAPLVDEHLGASTEYRAYFVVLLALALALSSRRRHALALLATAVAATTLLVKLTVGAACGATVVMYLVIERLRGRTSWGHVALYAGAYVVAVAALFTLTGNRAADLGLFLHYSLEILRSADLMSLPGPASEVLLAAMCFALLMPLLLRSTAPSLRAVAWLTLPALVVAYKHSFVRQDFHVLNLFTVFLGCFAALALFAEARRDGMLVAAGVLMSYAAATVVFANRAHPLPSPTFFDPTAGVRRMRTYADWGALRDKTAAEFTQMLGQRVLPPDLQAKLRGRTVDVVPYETSYVAANQLRWQPRPMFQSHLVATPQLDALNAAFFAGDAAPEYVLYHFDAVDGRHPFFDEPAGLRALWCHYTFERRERDLLVLQRRSFSPCGDLVPGERQVVRWGQEVPVPDAQDGLQLLLHIRESSWGWLRRVLFRAAVAHMMVTYVDGMQQGYRLVPRVAGDGLWIGSLPRDLDGVQRLLTGPPPPRVRSFRLLTAAPESFAAEISIEFARVADAPWVDGIRQATGAVDDAHLRSAAHDSANWLMHGGTYDEQRFSTLDHIDTGNVAQLRLAWSFDIDTDQAIEATPLAVDGVLYTTAPVSIVYAVDARTGRELWHYDPHVSPASTEKACCGNVNRGVAVYKGKVYVGALDGRLIALDAATGKQVWEALTVDPSRPYTSTGAPRVVEGKVIIGNAGADLGVRGYVSAYDADTGALVWRTFTVPGDPSQPFESPALERAAQTWHGDWWTIGGGGTVWDGIAYDPDLRLLYVGTGNGGPWNRHIRSPGGGDNLYLSSILALRPSDGALVWYYQETPGDAWDYASTQQIILADLPVGGSPRKVLLHAPKNGFFYVLDRASGQLLSAEKFAEVTWATRIDLATGRPVEVAGADYRDKEFVLKPSTFGAHGWHPMAFNPLTGLVYLPVQEIAVTLAADSRFTYRPGKMNTGTGQKDFPPEMAAGHLLAWDPVGQHEVWRVAQAGPWNGGTLTTAGNLVFQGTTDARFVAYRADTGEKLWEARTGTRILGGPITYLVDGVQYVSVMATRGGAYERTPTLNNGRLLTFTLGGGAAPAAAAR